jgi:hypothetical protein
MPDTTQPNLGYGGTTEATRDQVNIWMRSQPWYQQMLTSWGQSPDNVHLQDWQKEAIVRGAQANGVVVDQGKQEIDDSGNFRNVGHKLRNTLIVAGLAGATIATMGAAGAFSGAAGAAMAGGEAAGAGAGAAGAGAVGAGTLAGIEGGAYGLGSGALAGLGTGAMGATALGAGAGAAGAAGVGAGLASSGVGGMSATSLGLPATAGLGTAGSTGAVGAGGALAGGAADAGTWAADGTFLGPSTVTGAGGGSSILGTLGRVARNNGGDMATRAAAGMGAERTADNYADLNAAGQNNRALLDSAVFNRDLPSVQSSQVARGDLLSTMHDAAPTGDPRIDKFSGGGLRPSAFGPSTQQAGDALKREALKNLMAGGGKITPQLTTPKRAGIGENALAGAGIGLNILDAYNRWGS